MSRVAIASGSIRTHLGWIVKWQLHLCESSLGRGLNMHIRVVAAIDQLACGENGITRLGPT